MTHRPKIVICMGSQSDWGVMKNAADRLTELEIEHETLIISAHRTPDRLAIFAKEAAENGVQVIIAGAGGAAHLPGMVAAYTHLPVLGVPIESKLKGIDSLLSIAQMPSGVAVGTLAIGEAGAKNAGLLAAQILSLSDENLTKRIKKWRTQQTESVNIKPLDI